MQRAQAERMDMLWVLLPNVFTIAESIICTDAATNTTQYFC
jgi:hypothetical protein